MASLWDFQTLQEIVDTLPGIHRVFTLLNAARPI